jgi:DNA-binding NtrC family response regulator
MADQRRTNASARATDMGSIAADELIPTLDQPITHGMAPTSTVLICDDRPEVGRELSQTFRLYLPSIAPVNAHLVADGFALVDAFESKPADLVLIGIHAGATAGIDAINLLLGIHPQARTVVYGSVADVEMLAAAYAQGAGGLLVWEPTDAERPTDQHTRTTASCPGPGPRSARPHHR